MYPLLPWLVFRELRFHMSTDIPLYGGGGGGGGVEIDCLEEMVYWSSIDEALD